MHAFGQVKRPPAEIQIGKAEYRGGKYSLDLKFMNF